jgi:hypothetical protein
MPLILGHPVLLFFRATSSAPRPLEVELLGTPVPPASPAAGALPLLREVRHLATPCDLERKGRRDLLPTPPTRAFWPSIVMPRALSTDDVARISTACHATVWLWPAESRSLCLTTLCRSLLPPWPEKRKKNRRLGDRKCGGSAGRLALIMRWRSVVRFLKDRREGESPEHRFRTVQNLASGVGCDRLHDRGLWGQIYRRTCFIAATSCP